ncbi:SCP2 sterol-binding domain-containing protein [Reinekea sp.]|uniref:SCP2 sterol-binding domain-containing protein n=1 Tax=Reinekea sp. TaxID=1970455 RepID=UPI0039890649
MKFKALLWLMAIMYRRAARNNLKMKGYLDKVDNSILFTTDAETTNRLFVFKDQQVQTSTKSTESAGMTVRFSTDKVGFNTLWAMATGKDKNAFMKAIQDKAVKIEGDMMLLMWFQKSVKYIR